MENASILCVCPGFSYPGQGSFIFLLHPMKNEPASTCTIPGGIRGGLLVLVVGGLVVLVDTRVLAVVVGRRVVVVVVGVVVVGVGVGVVVVVVVVVTAGG